MEHTLRVQYNLKKQQKKAGIYANGPRSTPRILGGPPLGSVEEAIIRGTNIVEETQMSNQNRAPKKGKKRTEL